jgi:hypothetical protein
MKQKESTTVWWERNPFNFAIGRGGLHIRVRRWWVEIAWRPFSFKTGAWF